MLTTNRRAACCLALFAIASVLVMAAPGPASAQSPGSDGSDGAPADTAPPETSPPETAPGNGDGGSDGGASGEDSDDSNLRLILLAGLGLVALLALLVALSSSRARRRSEVTRAAPATPGRDLLGNAQWLHDQLSLELVGLPGADALRRWQSERPRLDEMAMAAQRHAAGSGGPAFREVAAGISALGQAIDTSCRVRSQAGVDPEVAAETVSVVNRHRGELQRAIDAARR